MTQSQLRRGNPFRKREKVLPVILFVFVFFLYYSLLSQPYFTDEQDVFFGGYYIAKGRELYRSYLTQHMPFSYYFAALPALAGARTIFQYRVFMYLMMAGCWEVIFLRHRKWIHPAALFAMPVLYLAFLKNIPMGTTMISDHWQGIGQAMILLEVVCYAERKEIPVSCALMVSLGFVLSFGTVFLAIYSVFCCFLAVVMIQLRMLLQVRRAGVVQKRKLRQKLLREDLRLIAICLVPFVLLLAAYAYTGNISNAYRGAYEVNTVYYPRYTGGLGSDPLGLFGTGVHDWGVYLISLAGNIPARLGVNAILLLSALGLVFFAFRMRKKSTAAGILVLLSTIYGGIRSFDGFHGMAYYAQLSAVLSLLLGAGMDHLDIKQKGIRRAGWSVLAGLSIILLADFGLWAGYNLFYPQILLKQTARAEEKLLDLLTDPGEEIAACDTPIFSTMVMDLELISADACDAVSIPWYYDMWKDQAMASIRKLPHILMYNPEDQSWGHVFREYAAEFDAYVRTHYTKLGAGESMWVENAFLPEAMERMRANGYGDVVYSNTGVITANTPREYHGGESAQGRFIAKEEKLCAVRFCASCYHRRSDPRIIVRLIEPMTGDVICESDIKGDEIADTFFSRCPMQAKLILGKEYEIRFIIEDIGGKGDMELYFTQTGELALACEYGNI